MPSSVSVGSLPPRSCLIFLYSSAVMPCCRRVSGEMAGVMEVAMGNLYCRTLKLSEEGRFGGTRKKPLHPACAFEFRRETGPSGNIHTDEIHHRRDRGTHRPRQNRTGKGFDWDRRRPPS